MSVDRRVLLIHTERTRSLSCNDAFHYDSLECYRLFDHVSSYIYVMCKDDAEGRIILRDKVENCLHEATSIREKAKEMKENAIRRRKAAKQARVEK
ncbi:hypothetical protein RJ641_010757 [Dillenia turbinata]|uniref:Uncharacterized protein n=1 Tax=Dillenia turbinata TaxID=194707 RepID=A0AAN8Z4K0_9MAGN